MALGKKLKDLRDRSGYTATEVAKNLGVERSSLSNYENDARKPDYETLNKLAAFYNVSVDYLISDSKDFLNLEFKTISLPYLNGLTPTLEGTALKIAEELGELSRAIGKFRGLSGEKEIMDNQEAFKEICKELLDVAQTSHTLMFLLEKEYGIDIDLYLKEHIEKLKVKGYIR